MWRGAPGLPEGEVPAVPPMSGRAGQGKTRFAMRLIVFETARACSLRFLIDRSLRNVRATFLDVSLLLGTAFRGYEQCRVVKKQSRIDVTNLDCF